MSPSSVFQFNRPDADLVLRSHPPEDPTDFHVHRCILASASAFFDDMFRLPQPKAEVEEVPVVSVSEDQTVLDLLLRFVYPIPDPLLPDLDTLAPVLGAAIKYEVTAVISALRKQLVAPRFVRDQPTRVFAIASRYELEDEAKLASRYTLCVNILDCPLSDDLKHITAYAYHRLLDLHRRRAQAALELLKYPEDVKCMQCNGSSYGIFMPPRWWTEFEKLAREELRVRPTSDKIFEMSFLARTADAAKCQRCPGSLLDSHQALRNLKRQIDELPSTI